SGLPGRPAPDRRAADRGVHRTPLPRAGAHSLCRHGSRRRGLGPCAGHPGPGRASRARACRRTLQPLSRPNPHATHRNIDHYQETVMSTSRRSFLARSSALALGSAALPWSLPARAAGQYPDKAVRLFVPYPPGAATDNLGRLAAQTYSEAYGQPFVVENRGGGGTTIGTRALAASDPDGYSIGMVDSAFTINPGLLGDKLPYDT